MASPRGHDESVLSALTRVRDSDGGQADEELPIAVDRRST